MVEPAWENQGQIGSPGGRGPDRLDLSACSSRNGKVAATALPKSQNDFARDGKAELEERDRRARQRCVTRRGIDSRSTLARDVG